MELEKRILMELQEATNKNDIQNKEIEIKEKNKAENLLKIKQLKEEEKLLDNENKEIKQSITNRKELIEKNKSKQEEINSQIEKIKNENVNDSIYKKNNKSKIFLAIFVTLIILCIIITITVKNYVFSGVIGAIALLDIALYANTIKKDIEYKKATHEAIDIELNKLIDEKKKTETVINEKEQELKEYEQNEKEITNKTSMIEGQIILLEKSNEQINVELNTINREQKDKDYSRTDEIITKYKDEFPRIEDLVNKGDYRTRDVDEKINNLKIMIKGLEIESSTIIPQLDEMVTLEEKLELNNTKLKELKKEEETINIAISTLTEAYEEMKNTITPKFTLNLSSSIKQISNNKYEKVTINDDNGMIVENNRGEYVDAAKLSTGTIDQLYLALRLSMIDDLSKEKLPIILDESFAYFDNSRLENILKYLNGELNNHQTIILTCTNREKDILDKINVEYNLVEL